jgi:hypothetical protein
MSANQIAPDAAAEVFLLDTAVAAPEDRREPR